MNETLKRAISGAIYILLLIGSTLYSKESFFTLFGVFMLIAVFEFCNLIQIKKVFPILFGFLLYSSIILVSFYKNDTEAFLLKNLNKNYDINININQLNLVLLVITMVVSIKCICFYFMTKCKLLVTHPNICIF